MQRGLHDTRLLSHELELARRYNEDIIRTFLDTLIVTDQNGRLRTVNKATLDLLEYTEGELIGQPVGRIFVEKEEDLLFTGKRSLVLEHETVRNYEMTYLTKSGRRVPMSFNAQLMRGEEGEVTGIVAGAKDMSDIKEAQAQLIQTAKLSALGQLAAGITHEINTPMQYIGDSVYFLQQAFDNLLAAFTTVQARVSAGAATEPHGDLTAAAREAEKTVDISYLREKVPRAFERTLEGIARVSAIVGAMREFAHPGTKDKASVDLNHALRSVLTMSHNKYEYVADVHVDFGDLPPVPCHLGEINQVFLNLILNAAHAIGDTVRDTGKKGTISIRTRSDGEWVRISIEDNGCGIPESARDKVFDPFFTTKQVGEGTGQGLFIARSIVVDKHGGKLSFESQVGRGTRFDIELPLRVCEKNTNSERSERGEPSPAPRPRSEFADFTPPGAAPSGASRFEAVNSSQPLNASETARKGGN